MPKPPADYTSALTAEQREAMRQRREPARSTRPAVYVRPAGDPRTEDRRRLAAAMTWPEDVRAVTIDLSPEAP